MSNVLKIEEKKKKKEKAEVGKKKKLESKWAIKNIIGTSLVVQWLRLQASNAGGHTDLIPGWGTKIPYATWHGKK